MFVNISCIVNCDSEELINLAGYILSFTYFHILVHLFKRSDISFASMHVVHNIAVVGEGNVASPFEWIRPGTYRWCYWINRWQGFVLSGLCYMLYFTHDSTLISWMFLYIDNDGGRSKGRWKNWSRRVERICGKTSISYKEHDSSISKVSPKSLYRFMYFFYSALSHLSLILMGVAYAEHIAIPEIRDQRVYITI